MSIKNQAAIRDTFDELVRKGILITHSAHEGDILYADNPVEKMHDTFRDYHLWKEAVRDFFLSINNEKGALYFLEADNVPFLKGGLEYSYIESKESQQLLKNIRTAATERLAYLRSVEKVIPKKPSLKSDNSIYKITCIKPKDGGNKFLMVVNDDYQNPIMGDRAKPTWSSLYEIATKGYALYQKKVLDYLNSNKNNRLYTQTRLPISTIVRQEGSELCPAIQIDSISEKAYVQRKNKT